jgi:hypothetical protein
MENYIKNLLEVNAAAMLVWHGSEGQTPLREALLSAAELAEKEAHAEWVSSGNTDVSTADLAVAVGMAGE